MPSGPTPRPPADALPPTGDQAAEQERTRRAAPADDWPAQAADTIERAVGAVRDKTTGPAIKVARAAVYGTFAVLVGTAVLVLVAISAVRALDVYLPDAVFGEEHTWAAHGLVGAVFVVAGMVLWSRRRARPGSSE